MCERHADALDLPRGWQLNDRRMDYFEVTLVAVPAPDSATELGAEPAIEIVVDVGPDLHSATMPIVTPVPPPRPEPKRRGRRRRRHRGFGTGCGFGTGASRRSARRPHAVAQARVRQRRHAVRQRRFLASDPLTRSHVRRRARDEQRDTGEHQQADAQTEQARERADDRWSGDHAEVAARGDPADRQRRMFGLVVHVGEQQRPDDRDADGGGRESGGRDPGVPGQRFERDAAGRKQRAEHDCATRPEPADDRTTRDTRQRCEAFPYDVRAHPREHTESEVRTEIEDAPGRDTALDHRRCREHEREHEKPFVPEQRQRARNIDTCSDLGGSGMRDRRVTAAVTTATTAMPIHAPRHDAPKRSATPVAAAPSTAPPLNSPWKRTSRPGSCESASAATMFITTSMSPPAAMPKVNAGTKSASVGDARFSNEQERPHNEAAAQRRARTPAVGQRAADRGDRSCSNDAGREQQAELGVAESERSLDVDGGDRPRAGEQAEHDERGGDRPQSDAHPLLLEAANHHLRPRRRATCRLVPVGRGREFRELVGRQLEIRGRDVRLELLETARAGNRDDVRMTDHPRERNLRRPGVVRLRNRAHGLDHVVRRDDVLGQEHGIERARPVGGQVGRVVTTGEQPLRERAVGDDQPVVRRRVRNEICIRLARTRGCT